MEDVAKEQGLLSETMGAIRRLAESAKHPMTDLLVPEAVPEGDKVEVILPGSFGWSLPDGRQEFVVEGYFVHPKDGLKYKGHLRAWENIDPAAKMQLTIACVEIFPGESVTGWYNFETGEAASAT